VKNATPTEDKALCSTEMEMGLFMFSMWGLRVSRLLDLEAVFGSKSDIPTRAKNCERMITRCPEKSKKFE
jgi:hypothetical protein